MEQSHGTTVKIHESLMEEARFFAAKYGMSSLSKYVQFCLRTRFILDHERFLVTVEIPRCCYNTSRYRIEYRCGSDPNEIFFVCEKHFTDEAFYTGIVQIIDLKTLQKIPNPHDI